MDTGNGSSLVVVMMLSSGLGPLLVEGEGVEEGPLTSGVLGSTSLSAQLTGSLATSKHQQNQKLQKLYKIEIEYPFKR